MNARAILTALDLPPDSRVDRRVPKTLLTEHGAPAKADKRRISEGIESLHWLAALKPETIGVPAYRDEIREYLEIAVLHIVLRPDAPAERLIELVHRAIPYPLLLLTEQASRTGLSAARKRRAQNEADKTVLDGVIATVELNADKHHAAFLDALALSRQPRASMFAVHQGWINAILALHAARLTGAFRLPEDAEAAAARIEALDQCRRLTEEIERLRSAAERETQTPRQVELNLAIKRLKAELAEAKKRL